MKKSMRCDCRAAPGSRREVLMLLAALGIGTQTAVAQDAARTEPRSYKVLFENAKVRVLEYVSRPGIGVCGTGKHSHPDHVTVTLTPAKVKLTTDDGKVQVNQIPAGSVFWDPASTHSAENIGGSGSRMVLIEIKDRDWKPASG
jgi:quercetin dioxygenase-like cupin family protein